MAKEWRNWAGDQACLPARIESPSSLAELVTVVTAAAKEGAGVRAVGHGHSFTDIACTGGVLIDPRGLGRVLDVDADASTVKVEAGIGLRTLNETIWGNGMALENLGDIDKQTISGAISTGTHGTGSRFRNISSQVVGMEVVLADGTLHEITEESDPDGLLAARVGLGALGIIATVTLRTVPAFTIHRIDSPLPLDETLDRIDDLADGTDHFEFYVFPHTETALLRQSERTNEEPQPKNPLTRFATDVVAENWVMGGIARLGRARPERIPQLAGFVSRQLGRTTTVDRSYRVYASQRRIRFTEMEYAIPRRYAAEAVPRVLEAAEKAEPGVGFPIEVRFVAGDEAMLSPTHERDACYIAVHQYKGMPWEPYFRAVEEIMDSYGGRPHWGKRHFQTAETLAERYPRWEDFKAVRARLDPSGAFANEYTDRVLGPVA